MVVIPGLIHVRKCASFGPRPDMRLDSLVDEWYLCTDNRTVVQVSKCSHDCVGAGCDGCSVKISMFLLPPPRKSQIDRQEDTRHATRDSATGYTFYTKYSTCRHISDKERLDAE